MGGAVRKVLIGSQGLLLGAQAIETLRGWSAVLRGRLP
jgi:hypothetical protein